MVIFSSSGVFRSWGPPLVVGWCLLPRPPVFFSFSGGCVRACVRVGCWAGRSGPGLGCLGVWPLGLLSAWGWIYFVCLGDAMAPLLVHVYVREVCLFYSEPLLLVAVFLPLPACAQGNLALGVLACCPSVLHKFGTLLLQKRSIDLRYVSFSFAKCASLV
jgi:hypothetical protein